MFHSPIGKNAELLLRKLFLVKEETCLLKNSGLVVRRTSAEAVLHGPDGLQPRTRKTLLRLNPQKDCPRASGNFGVLLLPRFSKPTQVALGPLLPSGNDVARGLIADDRFARAPLPDVVGKFLAL